MEFRSMARWPFALAALVLAASILSFPANTALAKPPLHVGHTTSVVKEVRGQLTGSPERRLVKADKVFFTENIVTSGDSVVVVQFRDGSTMELGPNGALAIDEMVFNPFERNSKKVVSLIQGSFRYMSAYVAKDSDVTIKTPVGTIGIRGSAASGLYYPNTPAFVHMSNGTATFTNDGGSTSIAAG